MVYGRFGVGIVHKVGLRIGRRRALGFVKSQFRVGFR